MRHPLAPLLLVLLLLAAACGGAEDADGGGTVGNADLDATEEVDADWARTATAHRDRVGDRFGYTCPADGTEHTVWGTSPYTDDSSVCTAAVHAGLISLEGGGRVVIEMADGLASYEGGEANGITTSDWPEWPRSYVFPSAP